MRILKWLIILTCFALIGYGLGQETFQPQVITVEVPVIEYVEVPVIEYKLYEFSSDSISIDEALDILEEGRFSHIIYKAALEEGLAEPTEWTGDIAFQNYVIERYDKVINLVKAMANKLMEYEGD